MNIINNLFGAGTWLFRGSRKMTQNDKYDLMYNTGMTGMADQSANVFMNTWRH